MSACCTSKSWTKYQTNHYEKWNQCQAITSLIFQTRKFQGMNTSKVMQSKCFWSGWFEWMQNGGVVYIIITIVVISSSWQWNQFDRNMWTQLVCRGKWQIVSQWPHHDTVPTCETGDGWQIRAGGLPVRGFLKTNEYSPMLQLHSPHTWPVRICQKVVKYNFHFSSFFLLDRHELFQPQHACFVPCQFQVLDQNGLSVSHLSWKPGRSRWESLCERLIQGWRWEKESQIFLEHFHKNQWKSESFQNADDSNWCVVAADAPNNWQLMPVRHVTISTIAPH